MAKASRKAKAKVAAAPLKALPPIEQWPAGSLERWPIARIKLNPRNARTHPEKQLAQLEASWREWGQTRPVLVDEGEMLIAGHGTLLGAQRAGARELFVVVARGWSEEKKRAYMLADNKLAENSGWNDELRGLELADLSKLPTINFAAMGFTDRDVKRMVPAEVGAGTEGLTDPDAVPSAVAVGDRLVSRRGDLWLLGVHRLLCGNSANADCVVQVMDGKRAVICNTDPPYGIDYSKLKDGIPRSGFADHQEAWGDIENDTLTDGPQLQAFLETVIRFAAAHAVVPNAAWYLWHPMLTQGTFFAAAAAADILIHRQIVWVKPGFVLTRSGQYHWQHELCFYGWVRGNAPPWLGDRSQSSVWQCGRDVDAGRHPTQKPIELFLRPILNHARPGEVIFEPFAGSGSQIIAAEQSGRVCYAIEIDPAYVDVAVRRWEDFTGKRAILAGGELTFGEVAAARRAEAKAAEAAAAIAAPAAQPQEQAA